MVEILLPRKQWIDFRGPVSQRYNIVIVMEQLLANEFPGEIVLIRPYMGGSKLPRAIVHTTVEFRFADDTQDLNEFLILLKRKLEPADVILEDWSDDDVIDAGVWRWVRKLFCG